MFNRIEVGEAIFCQNIIPLAGYPKRGVIDNSKNVTSFDMYLHSRDSRHLKRAIVGHVGPRGPYATGAYIISSPPGYSKLDGILRVIGMFNSDTHSFPELRSAAREVDWRTVAEQLREPGITLEATWRWLRQYDYLGGFHSYEIVTDLRHTALLNKAPDVMTWANVGPGARRGMNRVLGVDKNKRTSDEDVQDGMRLLLKMSRLRENWPQKKDWPAWELRDVEHTLCEFDKYERMRTGEGRSRGVYR
jgi:hypothetical protein